MNRLIPLSLAATLLSIGGGSPAIARADARPSAAKPRTPAVRAPAVKVSLDRFTLPNGLTVLVHSDHSVPTVFVGVWYKIGSKDEPRGRTGFAHLFEHLMFQQTANRQGEYFTPLTRAGATDMNGSTTTDYTNYYETVPTNALDLALWMESDRMGHLAGGITQAVLDEQRKVVLNEKRQAELDPEEAVRTRFLASFYPSGHPYAHLPIGSTKDVEAATLDDVRQWFTDYYGGGNAVLVLSGDIDLATARDKVTRYFGAVRPGKPIGGPLQWTPSMPDVRRDLAYGAFPATTLSRTWPIANGDPRETTLLQLAGRTMTRREDAPLVRALVATRLATDVSAEMTDGKLNGLFTISVTLRPGIAPAIAGRALDAALTRYMAQGPDPQRVEAVVAASDTAILRLTENAPELGTWLVQGEVDHGDPLFFLNQRDWIAAATPADIRAATARWLTRPYYETILLPTPIPAALPADVDRTRMPDTGPTNNGIAFPATTTMTLSNGIKLVVARRPGVAIVDTSMQFETGTLADPRYVPGTAATAFSMMMAGSPRHDSAAIRQQVAKLGMDMGASSGTSRSVFNWSSPADRLDASFALAADVLRHPLYPQAMLEQVNAGTTERLDAYERDPMNASDALFTGAVRGEADPRSHIAKRTDPPLSRDALVRFHDREIVPGAATLFMIGDIDPAQAKAVADRHFGDWTATSSASAPRAVALPSAPPRAPRLILVDAPGAGQSRITVGSIARPFDRSSAAAEMLATDVLADGSLGRLNLDLREDKGWTYGFGGGLSTESEGERLFAVGGSVQADRTADSLAELRRELTDYVSRRPITPDELEDRRGAAIRSIPSAFTGNAAFLASIMASTAAGLPFDYAKDSADRLSRVTLEQVRAEAARLYDPLKLTWVVIGDLKTIEPGIRALGIAPVEVRDVHGRLVR